MGRDESFYRAMLARDHRFDGKFFVGVKTTGIYCRPICPAKPKRENVEFFTNSYAAEKAGYRPCLRCRPEAAPRSSAWVGTSAVVRRAVRLIPDLIKIESEDEFARKFGVSARHLRRLFIEEIGKTPKQLMYEYRLNISRQLIIETGLPMTEIAAASGFRSVRNFNAAFRERFKKNPTQIRRQKNTDSKTITVTLAYQPPYDFLGLLDYYRRHAVDGLEWFEGDTMYRLIDIEGKRGTVAVWDMPERSCLGVEIDFCDISKIHIILSRVRRHFDLDSDPALIANALEGDARIRQILRKYPGVRIPSGWECFETAVAVILGQLVSLEQGRKLMADLIEIAGADSGVKTADGKVIKLFPTPKQVVQADLAKLRTTSLRKQTLQNFAEKVLQGEISLEPEQDIKEFCDQVKLIKGIGNWTADYMALRVLRDTDAFPETDLILARAIKIHPRHTIEKMRPWRAYVAVLLWREYHQKLSNKHWRGENK